MLRNLLFVFAFACTRPPVQTPIDPAPTIIATDTITTHLKLLEGDDGRIAAVLAPGTLAGHSVLFAIDTGSSGNVLAAWAIRRFGLTTQPTGHPHLGIENTVVVADAVRAPPVTIDGWAPIALESVDVLELPPALEEEHIAGLISPQLLASADRDVVIDLAERTMSLRAPSDAAAVLAAETSAMIDPPVTGCLAGDGGTVFITQGRIAGVEQRLLVDTGSTNTVVVEDSAAGKHVAGRARADDTAANGIQGSTTVQVAPATEVVVGAVHRSAHLELRPSMPQACGDGSPFQGTIGLDVLADCVLDIGVHTLRARCPTS